mmetsp:Transcript_674/g.1453  ORF Transcript_674/g.1453 Transcript_674/m.1453 type:complete len:229 (+) Transcript_674:364-1050(+)
MLPTTPFATTTRSTTRLLLSRRRATAALLIPLISSVKIAPLHKLSLCPQPLLNQPVIVLHRSLPVGHVGCIDFSCVFSWIAVVVHPFHFTDHLVVVVIATIAARSNCDGGGAIAGFAIPNPRPIIFGTLLTATPTATTTAAAALTLGTLGAATRTALRLGLGGLTMHLTPLAPHTRKQTPILILHLPLSIRTVILVNIARIPPFPSVLILILHVLDANLLFATGRGLA